MCANSPHITLQYSNLVAFYYGNLTNPSVDPPRIGFLTLVPDKANEVAQQDVQTAIANGGFFGKLKDSDLYTVTDEYLAIKLSASSESAPTSTISLTSRPVLHPASQIPSPIDEPGASGKTSASVTNFHGPHLALVASVTSILLSSSWIF